MTSCINALATSVPAECKLIKLHYCLTAMAQSRLPQNQLVQGHRVGIFPARMEHQTITKIAKMAEERRHQMAELLPH